VGTRTKWEGTVKNSESEVNSGRILWNSDWLRVTRFERSPKTCPHHTSLSESQQQYPGLHRKFCPVSNFISNIQHDTRTSGRYLSSHLRCSCRASSVRHSVQLLHGKSQPCCGRTHEYVQVCRLTITKLLLISVTDETPEDIIWPQ